MAVDRADLTSAGIREYLTKPVRSSEFYNRLLRLVATRTQPRKAPLPAAQPAPTPRPKVLLGRLLVAEDNEVNQLVARGMAARLGYEVDIVDDGAQAVAASLTGDYAAVLMDCHMPVMDGFEATRTIRARDNGGPRIPIIAMTAGALDEDRERCFAAGMDDYISKPVDVDKLGDILARWVPKAAAPDATARDRTTPDGQGAHDAPSGAAEVAAAPPSDDVLDLNRLQLLRELGPSLLPDAIRAFREEAGKSLATLQAALSERDFGTLAGSAHKLSGAAGNIGAVRAAALAKELERLGRAADPGFRTEGGRLLEQLESELSRVDDALERTLLGAP